MPLLAAILIFALSLGAVLEELEFQTPDPRIAERLDWAKQQLPRQLSCANSAGCDDVALNAMALTPLGRFDLVRAALTEVRERSPLWLVAAHHYWLASGDDAFVREQWASITNLLFTAQSDRNVQDGGVLLAAIEALTAMARMLDDSTALARARSIYTAAEQQAQLVPGLLAPALGLLDADRANAHMSRLADTVHARWPLGTGLVALGMFEYHRDAGAFELLEGMADQQTSTAAMFVLPLIRGLLGWEVDARHNAVALEPHLPADWTTVQVQNLTAGRAKLGVSIRRDDGTYGLHITRTRAGPPLTLHVSPAFPRGTRIRAVKVNGRDVPLQIESNRHDTHVIVEATLQREAEIEIEYQEPRSRN